MTVLGSRDQLCVHDKISKLKGGALNHACQAATSNRACTFKNNLENAASTLENREPAIMDIEDVKKNIGYDDRMCPYFYTREVSVNADLILLPYNYLLDNSIRATLKVDWQNSVIIFDEAHNLEKVASDASSFTLSSTDIAACLQELQSVLRKLNENKQHASSEKEGDDKKGDGDVVIVEDRRTPPSIQVDYSSNIFYSTHVFNRTSLYLSIHHLKPSSAGFRI